MLSRTEAGRLSDQAGGSEALVSVAFIERGREGGRSLELQEELAYSQMARNGGGATDRFQIMTPMKQVRRLTPRECERLQGFPDDHTLIPWRGKMAPEGPRYKALGNSMAVPVMRWIGERISQMNAHVDAQIPASRDYESITD